MIFIMVSIALKLRDINQNYFRICGNYLHSKQIYYLFLFYLKEQTMRSMKESRRRSKFKSLVIENDQPEAQVMKSSESLLKQRQKLSSLNHCSKYVNYAYQTLKNIDKTKADTFKNLNNQDNQPPTSNFLTSKPSLLHQSSPTTPYENKNFKKKTIKKNMRMSYDFQADKTRIKNQIKFPSQKILQPNRIFYPISQLNKEEEVVEICRIIKQKKSKTRTKKNQETAIFQAKQIQKFLQLFFQRKKTPYFTFDYDGSILQMNQPQKNEEFEIIEMMIQQHLGEFREMMEETDERKDQANLQKQANGERERKLVVPEMHTSNVPKIVEYQSPYLINFEKIQWNKNILKYTDNEFLNEKEQLKTLFNEGPIEQVIKQPIRKKTHPFKFRSYSQSLTSNPKRSTSKQSQKQNIVKITNDRAYRQQLLIIPKYHFPTKKNPENPLPLQNTLQAHNYSHPHQTKLLKAAKNKKMGKFPKKF